MGGREMIIEETKSHEYNCPMTLAKGRDRDPCRGSACMAWRWDMILKPVKDWAGGEIVQSSKGYCGMAGIVKFQHGGDKND